MNNTYRIYTRWVAVALRRLGFKILYVDVNEYHPELDVWVFKNSDDFQEALTEITRRK